VSDFVLQHLSQSPESCVHAARCFLSVLLIMKGEPAVRLSDVGAHVHTWIELSNDADGDGAVEQVIVVDPTNGVVFTVPQ
jgi:hypothetical protein